MAVLDFGTVKYCNLVADKQQNVYTNACNGVGLGRIFHEGLKKRRCFHLSYSWNLQWGRFAKLLELLSLKNLPINIGEEQKKIIPHSKRIISSIFELFCNVDFSWILSIGFPNSQWGGGF